jgi:prepilin-type N-terminal cleavage/methylation domain-containing protein
MTQRRSSGLTLVEMLVVLAIMGTVIVGLPTLLLSMRQQGAGHAVNQVRADLQRARVMAIKQKHECSVEFNKPGINQYANTFNHRISDLTAYQGGVHFMQKGPDGDNMTAKVAFNRKGMSTTIAPKNIYLSNQSCTNIYRVSILPPGGIFVHRWNGQNWQ